MRKLTFQEINRERLAREQDYETAGKEADKAVFEKYGRLPLHRKPEERQLKADAAAAAPAFLLNECELDVFASISGWEKVSTDSSKAPMASYKKDDMRLNFWLTTGAVGSYLTHPSQGKAQLFPGDFTQIEANKVSNNPRQQKELGIIQKRRTSRRNQRRRRRR